MPSPTSSTRPTSRVSALVRNWPISASRTEAISSALNLMGPSCRQLIAETLEFGPDGGVEHLVADADDHAPDQFGRLLDDDHGRLPQGGGERPGGPAGGPAGVGLGPPVLGQMPERLFLARIRGHGRLPGSRPVRGYALADCFSSATDSSNSRRWSSAVMLRPIVFADSFVANSTDCWYRSAKAASLADSISRLARSRSAAASRDPVSRSLARSPSASRRASS